MLCRRMTAREMEGLIVMLQEERGEVSQGVLGCNGKSGVCTTAVPSNASFKALAIGQLPVAKNPCRNNIFFMCAKIVQNEDNTK